ncbi:MAG: hypothetical protein KME28_15410 [Pelatocladus maniniholoensis HA4357-MV3]|uniref:Uncharacterized protein n=1 Tax=Pelatocladus maniniholoensis HA4357-MV3 TaxID=1117104 RepID=A0A9E3H9F6_9NOST|nr:hypothetical protein [Pelatocladus maniniholoensis HA4357-MV3]
MLIRQRKRLSPKKFCGSLCLAHRQWLPQKNLFGSLAGLILSPVQQALQGVLLGIGAPIGMQLGSGIAKGVQSSLGSQIGSLELIAQRATEKSIQAIPKIQQELVETIRANPIGNVVVKQLETLQQVLERFSINLSSTCCN